jgi:hypothetical protein
MVLRVHHVQLAIPPGREPEADSSTRGSSASSGSGNPRTRPAGKAHPAFVVRDLQATEDALSSAERPLVVDTQLEGYRRFYTEDPFGNRIEILAEDRSASGS